MRDLPSAFIVHEGFVAAIGKRAGKSRGIIVAREGGSIVKRSTLVLAHLDTRSTGNRGHPAVWQRRFWEHTIQDEDDFQTHFDYVHYNPVKHKLVKCPGDWQASSFHRWVKAGVYPSDWACGKYPPPIFPVTEEDNGEAF